MPAPFLSGWDFRKPIQYGTVFPSSNLTDYPLLVVISADSDIAVVLTSGGGITITTDDGVTEIPFGTYPNSDPSSGDITLRFFASDVLTAASTGDVIGYIYYDSGQTTAEDKAGVVANDYALFAVPGDYGSGDIIEDWVTGDRYAGGGGLSASDLVAGVFGLALDYDGTNDYIATRDIDLSECTLEAICKSQSASGGQFAINKNFDGSNVPYSLSLFGDGGNTRGIAFFSSGWKNVPTATDVRGDNTWHSVAGTFLGSGTNRLKFYLDGPLDAQSTSADGVSSLPTNNNVVDIGRYLNDSAYFPGPIAETRVSSIARSADWLAYAYTNDFANTDTVTLGAQETNTPTNPVTWKLMPNPQSPTVWELYS